MQSCTCGQCEHYIKLKAMSVHTKIFKGNIIHCLGPCPCPFPEVIEDGCLVVHLNTIVFVGDAKSFDKQRQKYPTAEIVKLTNSQILIPGLVDGHIHAPQYPNVGLGYDMPSRDWLFKYVYPLEMLYKDQSYAQLVYDAVVKKTLSHGTTTACYYGSLYKETTLDLVEAAANNGQRAYVGKVNMVQMAPENYLETTKDSIADTRQFIKDVQARQNPLLTPVITPRIATCVDMELMLELSDLAKEFKVPIHSQLAVDVDEFDEVQKFFGTGPVQALDSGHMLTHRSIMAHAIHLQDEDLSILKCRGTSIVHCPSSNILLRQGICDIRRLFAAGIKVGLGTAICGGAQPSIVQVMRDAINVSIFLSFVKENYVPLTYSEVFYLATIGGARALSLDGKVGNFVAGKDFDAIIVDMNVSHSSADYLKDCDPLELLQKFIFLGDDRNVVNVFVSGKMVK